MMTTIRFIGDVHGKFRRYKTLLDNSPYPTIQVGDMGVGFRRWPHGEPKQNPPYDAMVAGRHRFIRGNHDNPAACSRHSQHITDGTIEGSMMFVGGGFSIDRAYRVEGFSYWTDEELDQSYLDVLIDDFSKTKPSIMVTHDTVESVAAMILATIPHVGNGQMKMDPRFASRTRVAFERMFAAHKPKLWIFGHWHVPFDYLHEGCRFICLPELGTVDINTESP